MSNIKQPLLMETLDSSAGVPLDDDILDTKDEEKGLVQGLRASISFEEAEYLLVLPKDISGLSKALSLPGHEDTVRKQLKDKHAMILKRLRSVGLEIHEVEPDVPVEETYFLVDAPDSLLEKRAEALELEKRLNDHHGGGFAQFTCAERGTFKKYKKGTELFKTIEKLRIIEDLVRGTRRNGGAHLNMRGYVMDGVVSAFFPLHEEKARDWLMKNWVWNINDQPLRKVRNYFGEKLALYFTWLGFYTCWLWSAAAFGLIIFAIELRIGFDSYAALAYAVFISVWATLFLEFWKRKQATVAWKWNMQNYEMEEKKRPEFVGSLENGIYWAGLWLKFDKEAKTDETLANVYRVHAQKRYQVGKYFINFPLIFTLILAVVFAAFGIIIFKEVFSKTFYGPYLGAALNGVAIMILEVLYRWIAIKLNNWENHRTDTAYEDNLILKYFLFQFVNAYIALFYIAFMKNRQWNLGFYTHTFKSRCSPDCLTELSISLGTILFTRLFILNAIEVLWPLIYSRISLLCGGRKRTKRNTKFRQLVAQRDLSDYAGVLDQYNEMVIQFGYVTLFAPAFPLAPLLALVSNLVEIRSDAFTYLVSTKRPQYEGAKDIGTWYHVLELMSYLAVICNMCLIAFTQTVTRQNALLVALLFENLVFFLKWLIAAIIPDTPTRVKKQLAREDFLHKYANGTAGIGSAKTDGKEFWTDEEEELEEQKKEYARTKSRRARALV